jgi:hypothetical protein
MKIFILSLDLLCGFYEQIWVQLFKDFFAKLSQFIKSSMVTVLDILKRVEHRNSLLVKLISFSKYNSLQPMLELHLDSYDRLTKLN